MTRRRDRLTEVESFGPNPGGLRMLAYAPPNLVAGAPLVVVLHGCSQNARGYDRNAGWTSLAEQLGFAVLYPEQRAANNAAGCFNWFLTADKARGLGETRSIREMIETMTKTHRLCRGRIFVTGLSAGGAMAAALLADYPEVFSAGAIIAGLPCGVAASVQEAFDAMARPAERTPEELGDAVRANSSHDGLWPRVAVWHGTADATVAPRNADELVKQWLNVHGAPAEDFREELFDGHRRRVWRVDGRDVVESVLVAGLGHGAPLDARMGEVKGPFMLEAGISSTRRIAAFFKLDVLTPTDATMVAEQETAAPRPRPSAKRPPERPVPEALSPDGGVDGRQPDDPKAFRSAPIGRFDIGATIAKALRAAGLMR
ncbi:extracellular catalytic domain type 1 short-chain-length polyhydroxyalkanoate depolymerase [Hansschlegelia zhihuaiae]|uniref:PHB depolymerase family esterase n=1 Tax=Hansschlegelia zhihuaiae TaxID=405005 RepID=A0A4V1KJX1_9HYPH|nr:PHB depolymerase family esterase [Hansschlegelia zhihuaiae]RXF75672.1 PHB depolymerase family esterase [Hansschlegelia zhihuaiae]